MTPSASAAGSESLVFFLDVDNTLLDNDRLKEDLETRLVAVLGPPAAASFWDIYERVRETEDYVDIPETVNQFESQFPGCDRQAVEQAVLEVPFREYLYPRSFDALAYLDSLGKPVILSDGDPVFQRKKIEDSGLSEAVGGRVLLTVHKQHEMAAAFDSYPATHYVMIDDKTTILSDLNELYGDRVTTMLVKQGKYADVPAARSPDVSIQSIGDVAGLPRQTFFAATSLRTRA